MELLLRKLNSLYREFGLVALKGGTEVEDMTFDEIAFLKALGEPILPLIVKIGGPEARNDMRALKALGVHGILAPMIESEYALKNFVEAVLDTYEGEDLPALAINIETITAFNNLDSITGSPFFARIGQVTVGRSDLAGSMGRKTDDEEVMGITEIVVRWAENMGRVTSVGGKITGDNAPVIRSRIRPARINTRHMVYDLTRCVDIVTALNLGLEFEVSLYDTLAAIEPSKKNIYRERIEATRERMSRTEAVRSAAS